MVCYPQTHRAIAILVLMIHAASDSGRDIEDDSRGLLYSVDKAERKWRASIAPTEVSIPTSRNRAPSLASTSRNSDMRSDISRLTERAKGLQLVDKSRAERFVLEDEACKEEEHNRLRKLKQDRKFDNERRDSERGIITPTPSDYSGRSEYLRPIDLGESFDGTDPIIDNLMAGKARSNASNSTYSKASSKSNRLRVPRSSHGGSTILSASGSRRPPSMHSQSHHSSNSRALVPGPPPSHHSIESAPSQAVSRRTLRRVPRKIYDDSDSEDDRRRRPAPLPTSSTNITIINTINSRR